MASSGGGFQGHSTLSSKEIREIEEVYVKWGGLMTKSAADRDNRWRCVGKARLTLTHFLSRRGHGRVRELQQANLTRKARLRVCCVPVVAACGRRCHGDGAAWARCCHGAAAEYLIPYAQCTACRGQCQHKVAHRARRVTAWLRRGHGVFFHVFFISWRFLAILWHAAS